MSRELDHIRLLETENLLEPTPDCLEDILALRGCAGALVALDALADGAGPQADSVEALAHVDHHAHDFVVGVLLEGLADGGELCV